MAVPLYLSAAHLARESQRGTPAVALGRARDALRRGDAAEALTCVSRLLARQPVAGALERACAFTLRGLALLRLGRPDEAAGALWEAVPEFERSGGSDRSGLALVEYATALALTGRTADALLPAVTAARHGFAMPVEALTDVVDQLVDTDRRDDGRAVLAAAVESGPPDVDVLRQWVKVEPSTDALLALVEQLLEDGRAADATAVLGAAAAHPRLALASVAASICSDDLDGALASYRSLPDGVAAQPLEVALAAAGAVDEISVRADAPSAAHATALLAAGRAQEALEEARELPGDRVSARVRAAAHEGLGHWLDAAAELRPLLTESPGETDLVAAVARLEALAGITEAALATVDSELRRRPGDAVLHSARAVVLAVRGEYEQAVGAARLALQLEPDLEQSRGALARGLFGSGHRDKGLAEAELLLRQNPDDPEALYVVGCAQLDQGNVDLAVEALDRLAAVAPWHYAGTLMRARGLLAAGRVEAALDVYETAIRRWPKNEELHLQAARCAWQNGFLERARLLLERTVTRFGTVEAHAQLGEVLRRSGDLEAADRHLLTALNLQPDRADCLGTRGQIRLTLGDIDGGMTLLRAALNRDPQLVWAHAALGEALRREGRLSDALVELDRAITLAPEDPWPRAGRAATLAERRLFALAVEEADRVVALDERYAFGWSVKAIAHLSLDELDEALTALDRAIACDGTAGWAWATRAAVRGLMGAAPADQLADLHRAVALDPGDPHARVALGFVLLRQGGRAAADEQFQAGSSIIESDSTTSATLLNGAAWALLGLGRWDRAAELCAEVTTIDPEDVEFHIDYGLALLCATAADAEDEPELREFEAALHRAAQAEDHRLAKHLVRTARRNLDDLDVAAADHPRVLAALADARRALDRTVIEEVPDAARP